MGDPIIVRQDVLAKSSHGQHDRVLVTQAYLTSLDDDDRTAWELFIAKQVTMDLENYYPGHGWKVRCEVSQGAVFIWLPVLMGENWKMFIPLDNLTPVLVANVGGEILERYRLPRGRFELGSFLEAREKHSILLDRTKKVPE